jgi:hypothetical protein
LLTAEPERAFNYAVNYVSGVGFVMGFLMEGVKRDVLHLTNVLGLIVRYLFFKLEKGDGNHQYVGYRDYLKKEMGEMLGSIRKWQTSPLVNSEVLAIFKKTVHNYEISQLVTLEFLSLYVKDSEFFRFMYDEGARKTMLVEAREQPMTKASAQLFKHICGKVEVDIVELSLFELLSKVNSMEDIDN